MLNRKKAVILLWFSVALMCFGTFGWGFIAGALVEHYHYKCR